MGGSSWVPPSGDALLGRQRPRTLCGALLIHLPLGAALFLLALDQILSLKFMVFLAACYLGRGCKVGHAPVSFMVLLSMQLEPVY